MFDAFNRWLEEDWGFAYENRIFAAPYISLADVDAAVKQLEWALDKGARLIVMRPAAPNTPLGQRPPAFEWFDPFWARVNEAGITVVAHAGDSGYSLNGYGRGSFASGFGGGGSGSSGFGDAGGALGRSNTERRARPSVAFVQFERAIYDFLASLVLDDFFGRFPNIRVASVENGAEFLPDMFRKLRSAAQQDADAVQRGPGRDVQPQHLDQPVLGGRRQRGRRVHGRRPRDLRVRLAAHRGHAASRSTTCRS